MLLNLSFWSLTPQIPTIPDFSPPKMHLSTTKALKATQVIPSVCNIPPSHTFTIRPLLGTFTPKLEVSIPSMCSLSNTMVYFVMNHSRLSSLSVCKCSEVRDCVCPCTSSSVIWDETRSYRIKII